MQDKGEKGLKKSHKTLDSLSNRREGKALVRVRRYPPAVRRRCCGLWPPSAKVFTTQQKPEGGHWLGLVWSLFLSRGRPCP